MNLDELVAHLDVKTNILNEKRAEIERHERGVRAMAEASNRESQWASKKYKIGSIVDRLHAIP